MKKDRRVRVRFAPSPTGPLHIGSARTALFNWLFARSHQGDFVLRIEDTDLTRSQEKYESEIKSGLQWLGLSWDEFYRQSDRTAIYRDHLERLLSEKKAYYCFCSKEELEERRQAMLAQGLAPKYPGKCRDIPEQEAYRRMKAGEDHVIRLKVPDTKVSFHDLIRGEIDFDGTLIGDIIIARDLDSPLYNFVAAVDDALMDISHVIRGEDHISNTPKQILLFQAFGYPLPEFAHLPMILNLDRSKMSKRFANVALHDYIQQGYIAEALLNFLALLGWHPQEDREVMSLQELLKEFDLKRVQKGGAVFNVDKLDWLNNHHLKELSYKRFLEAAKDFLPADWQLNKAMVDALRGRIERLDGLAEAVRFYFELPEYQQALLKWKEMNFGEVELSLNRTRDELATIPAGKFKKDYLQEKFLSALSQDDRGVTLWPLRVALSGEKESPGPFEIMEALGKSETLRRISVALEKLVVPETH